MKKNNLLRPAVCRNRFFRNIFSFFNSYKIYLLVLFVNILSSYSVHAQSVAINTIGAVPNASALLDVDAAPANNKGLLIPRVSLTSTTDVTTIPSPATSLLVYNTNAAMTLGGVGYWYWDGAKWVRVSGNDWSLTGNSGTTVGTNFLGTTDANDLAFYTNNSEKMRITTSGNIGIGTPAPGSSAKVDISSTTQGFLMPRMTTVQRYAIAAPLDGLQVYDTDLKGYYYYNAIKWDCVTTPAGTVDFFANSTAPNGYLECNGQAVSRTQYPELFAAIAVLYGIGDGVTTFNLPDLRGEFIRGLDNGRGVDISRGIGTWQVATAIGGDGDGFNIPVPHLGNPTHWTVLGLDADVLPKNLTNLTMKYSDPNPSTCTINGAASAATASTCVDFARTRPRNVALLPCIKY